MPTSARYKCSQFAGRSGKTLAKAGLGGIGEGNEEIASEVISRLGQWLTYQNDKTIREMLLSGEAREAYLDSFLGGFALGAPAGAVDTVLSENDGSTPKKTQGKPLQNQTTGPKTDIQMAQPQVTMPGETGKPTTASRPDDAPRRVLLTEPEGKVDTLTEPAKPATTPKTPQIQPEAIIPDTPQDTPKTQTDILYYTTDTWTNDLNGVWTDRNAVDTDTDADSAVTPVRYEDALGEYLRKGTEPTAVLNTGPDAEPSVPQEAAPKPKEKIISELAPKIRITNMTPGRAMIAAEQTYADAEKRFGANASAVLEQIEPGQNPRKFLDGFENAYLSGKMGSGAALKNSSVAAYLTEEQREAAYELGEQAGQGLEKGGNDARITLEEAVAAADKPYEISLRREVKKEIIRRGITAETTIFTNDTADNPLATYAQNIPKMDGFYDVVMHGVDTAVWFFDTKIDAYTLSQIIRQRPDYKKGTPIRLLSCNTGNTDNTGDCVAQLLANELEVTVIAPNQKLYVYPDGACTVGRKNQGEMKEFFSRKVEKYSEVYYGY